jgi:hypothetical protein
MNNFILRTLVALGSSGIAFCVAFDTLAPAWGKYSLSHNPERGLGPAAALGIQFFLISFGAAFICFLLVFFLMGFTYPILRRKNPDQLS